MRVVRVCVLCVFFLCVSTLRSPIALLFVVVFWRGPDPHAVGRAHDSLKVSSSKLFMCVRGRLRWALLPAASEETLALIKILVFVAVGENDGRFVGGEFLVHGARCVLS